MARLTDTQLIILSADSQRDDHGVELPANAKGEAAGRVVDKLIPAGSLEEVGASGSLPIWRRDDSGGAMALRITRAGLAAIGAADQAAPEETSVRSASTRESATPAPEAIASRKRISVAARTPPVRGVAQTRRRPRPARTRKRPGSNKLECSRCWPTSRSDDCCHHARNPLAAAFGPRLLRRCGAQEARPRSRLGEGRRRPGLSHRPAWRRSFQFPPIAPCPCRKLDPHVLVMQSTQDWAADYATNGLDGARDRRILVQ